MHASLLLVYLVLANSEGYRIGESERAKREIVVEGGPLHSLKVTPLLVTLGLSRHCQFFVIEL